MFSRFNMWGNSFILAGFALVIAASFLVARTQKGRGILYFIVSSVFLLCLYGGIIYLLGQAQYWYTPYHIKASAYEAVRIFIPGSGLIAYIIGRQNLIHTRKRNWR